MRILARLMHSAAVGSGTIFEAHDGSSSAGAFDVYCFSILVSVAVGSASLFQAWGLEELPELAQGAPGIWP